MRAQVTPPTAATALGLRAQLLAAADNDLGKYLDRNDQTARPVIRAKRSKIPGGAYTTDAPWAIRQRAEIRQRLVEALVCLGESTADAIAKKAGYHVTCVYKHLPAIVADGRVISLSEKPPRRYRAAPVSSPGRP